MRLYEEINEAFKESRCAFFPNGGGYFQGVKNLGDFSETEIVICFKKEKISVRGKELTIKKYCDGDLELSGKIYAVEVLTEGVKT